MKKKIETAELKEIQLNILKEVDSFCKLNNINYWIDCGTLLGAIRHKGYIPWDDDIDIGMLRPDFDRFLQLFNDYSSRYKAYSNENKKDFYYAHGKVLDLTTELYEPDETGLKLSVNIDVFVYDNAPDSDRKVKKMYKRRNTFRTLNIIRNTGISSRRFLRRIIIKIIKVLLKIFPRDFFVKKMIKNSKKYADKETKRVGNFTSYSEIVVDKSVFNNFIEVEFEGGKYPAPIGYDKWLTAFYGNYMELPPLEKRMSHHEFVAYKTVE